MRSIDVKDAELRLVLQLEHERREDLKENSDWLWVWPETTPMKNKSGLRRLRDHFQLGAARSSQGCSLLGDWNHETFWRFKGFIIQKEGTCFNQYVSAWEGPLGSIVVPVRLLSQFDSQSLHSPVRMNLWIFYFTASQTSCRETTKRENKPQFRQPEESLVAATGKGDNVLWSTHHPIIQLWAKKLFLLFFLL